MSRSETAKRRIERAAVTSAIGGAIGAKGMKWKDVAWIIGKTPATVSTRTKEHNWKLEELVALSRALGVNFVIGEDK